MTALGINNNGELIFPYGKEDTDYNIEGNASSGYVYNGATSTFWCRLRDLCASEITNTFANVVATDCFSAVSLINQFDTYQECYPEEVWRLDIERKYIRTFTGASVDNSIEKSDVQYLRDMMQGRKKYQRRQWIRDQEIYFGTKNLMNTVVGDNNRITFRCFTPTGDDIVVEPDYTLSITPYSDMYVSVMFGNGDVRQVRAKGGQAYTIECPLSTMDDTQVVIYGANRIQALNDLSACYIAANNFSMATKLRKLILGNTTEGYNNSRLTSLTLGNNELLEELDIRNCSNLRGTINLVQCSNLLKLYAEGTGITGVTFATNGKLQVAHLPSTVNTLTMRNLNNLTDFQAVLNRLETLTLEGGTLDNRKIIEDCISTLQVLYLYSINWELSSTELLNSLANLYYSLVTGSVYVSGQIRNQELETYASKWGDLEVKYNPENLVTQYLVTYVNADGSKLYETYIDRGSKPIDPVSDGLISTPTRATTAQYSYAYTGWDENIEKPVLSATTITAQYSATVQKYTVTWYSRPGLPLGSIEADYGSEVVYSGDTPTNDSEEDTYVYNLFAGWDKSTGYITGNIDVYAVWQRAELPAEGTDLSTMTPAQIFAVVSNGSTSSFFVDKDYIDITLGDDFNFSNVESKLIASDLVLDGSNYVDTGIKLFDANERSFTLAIDFQFSATDVDGTILSCFEFDGSEGFRLRFNGNNPSIQWGNANLAFGYGKYRDMLVLRHFKGSEHLYLYYSNNTSDADRFSNSTTAAELVRSRATSTDSTLILGAIRFPLENTYENFGAGIIHWCKIWYDDLGDTNAKALANWYHEKIRMEYYGSRRYTYANGIRCAASFISNSLLEGRYHRMNNTNTNAGGWDACDMRTFLNNKVYKAFPTVWRSLIKQVNIPASAGEQSQDILTSQDMIYLPAYGEVTTVNDPPYVNEGVAISWFTSNKARLKFRGVIVSDDATYFTSDTDPTVFTTNTVKIGDIWIDTSEGNNGRGRILVDRNEAARRNLTGLIDAQKTSMEASWFGSSLWWERSPSVLDSAGFMDVGYIGHPHYYYSATSAYGVCPCFSI